MLLVYSYWRYSSGKQKKGDSIRRQDAAAKAWCQRNNARLDDTACYQDKGVSAFRGKNRETGVLRQFLRDIELGRIPRGAVLLIENMDRLSREKPVPAVHALTSILMAGVRVVQLSPDEIELTEDSDLFALFRGQMSQARGHDESAMKSARLTEKWAERKRLAREEGQIITKKLPAWVAFCNGKLVLRPDRAAIVRLIFRLCISGHGLYQIVKHLTEKEVPCWGRGAIWSKAYVKKILSGRVVLGEHQPMHLGEPDGDPIPDYYPRVIDDSTWLQAQAAMIDRKQKPGRLGQGVASLWRGLLWDARTRTRMAVANQTYGPKGRRYQRRTIRPAGAMEGACAHIAFPAEVFEDEILSRLDEIKVADVIGEVPSGESTAINDELVQVEARMKLIEAELSGDGEDPPALIRSLRALNDRFKELSRRLAEAQQKEANPLSAAWQEAKSLAKVAKDPEKRIRLRTILARIVDSIWVLIVPRKSHRLVAVQIYFAGGARRDYLIHYAAAGYCRERRVETLDVAWTADDGGPGRDFNLRNARDAKAYEVYLTELPL